MTTLLALRTELSDRLNANVWQPAEKDRAINAAIRDAYPAWFTETFTDELVVCEDKLFYNLPTMTRLIGVWLERPGEYFTGVATSGTNASLTDSAASWTVNEYAGWHVVIYDGTGAGQYASVTSNTATALTLTTSGYNWTVAPDTTSYYMLKNVVDQNADYTQILAYNVDKNRNPTKLWLKAQYTPGFYLKLHYITEPTTLTADTDDTDVPAEYIINCAAGLLWFWRMGKAPGNEVEPAQNLATMFKGLSDDFKTRHAMRWPTETMKMERETRGSYVSSDYPFEV
jgi:hypothetical protein